MDDDSFDPHSWAKKPQQTGKNQSDRSAEPLSESRVPGITAPPGSSDSRPEAWRIGRTEAALQHDSFRDGPDRQSGVAAQRVALIVSAVLLAVGAGAAWQTRIAPVAHLPETTGVAAPAAKVPGAFERRLVLAGVSDIAGALVAAGVGPDEAKAAAEAAAKVLTGSGEIHVTVQLLPQGKGVVVNRLQASKADGSGAVVSRDGSGAFSGSQVAAELSRKIYVLRGELDTDSFYSSAVAAGLVDSLIPEFINAFAYDFNLASEVAPGDTFEVAYMQSVDPNGTAVGQPQLLFASLTTKAKSLALYRFVAANGEVGWYDGNGGSTKRGLMRTPVDGARITSKFGMRFHPVLNYNKMHKGVDFAAPIGTPIYAAKDGTVTWAAMKGPNGNLTVLQHDKDMQTYYLHQSMFMPGVTAGAHVTQGQKIGEIGTTGRSTGPHLHFEVHLGGEPVDPLSIQSGDDERKRLDGATLQAYIAQRNRVDVARAKQAS